jgi:hypothetical protein
MMSDYETSLGELAGALCTEALAELRRVVNRDDFDIQIIFDLADQHRSKSGIFIEISEFSHKFKALVEACGRASEFASFCGDKGI